MKASGHRNGMYHHGMTKTPIYMVWAAMKKRCDCVTNKDYKWYGGRGIGYQKSWRDFVRFYKDMGGTYKRGLTLERVDNSMGYSKENCKWVTWNEQRKNKSNNIVIEYNGKKYILEELSKLSGIHRETLRHRIINLNWSTVKSLNEPIR